MAMKEFSASHKGWRVPHADPAFLHRRRDASVEMIAANRCSECSPEPAVGGAHRVIFRKFHRNPIQGTTGVGLLVTHGTRQSKNQGRDPNRKTSITCQIAKTPGHEKGPSLNTMVTTGISPDMISKRVKNPSQRGNAVCLPSFSDVKAMTAIGIS